MEEETVNFWPAVTDLMLAIVLLLILVISTISLGLIDTGEISLKQSRLAESVVFQREGLSRHEGRSGEVEWRQAGQPLITFATDKNNPFLQRISFSDSLLFDPDNAELKPRGRDVLQTVGRGIRSHSDSLEQIHIHGHADIRRTVRYRDNLELASHRANAVFRFLQGSVGLDPLKHVMAASSFGEYVPVERQWGRAFGEAELVQANGGGSDESLMRQNRRIEMLLFYRRDE